MLLVDVLVIGDVLDDLGRGQQFVRVVVGDLEAELVLHGHDDLNVIERVETKILDEMGVEFQLK